MSSGADRPRPSRAWWAAPLILAAATGAGVAAFALPGLAGGASVPDRLVVHRSPAAAHPPHATPVTHAPTTHVVSPERPVVRESSDSHEDNGTRSPGIHLDTGINRDG